MRTVDQPAEILLVEDSPDDTAFFVHTLGKSGVGARLHVVGDGAEALDFIRQTGRYVSSPAAVFLRLIVLDLKLPKLDGLQVLEAVKTDKCIRTIPVVVLSSSLEARDLAESYRLGANSYILKPMDFDQYGECVRALLRYWLDYNRTPKVLSQ